MRVCWLKAHGINRFAAMRATLWIGGLHELPIKQRRADIHSEFRRARKRTLRSRGAEGIFPPTDIRDFKSAEQIMMYGAENPPPHLSVQTIFSSLGFAKSIARPDEFNKLLSFTLSEVLGEPVDADDPDFDQSAESMIGRARQNHWERARSFIQQIPWMILKGQPIILFASENPMPTQSLSKAFMTFAKTATEYQWRLRFFVTFLAAIARRPEISDDTASVLIAISKIRSMLSAEIKYRRDNGRKFPGIPFREISLLLRNNRLLSPNDRAEKMDIEERMQEYGLGNLRSTLNNVLRRHP